jgi:hypothetical protein
MTKEKEIVVRRENFPGLPGYGEVLTDVAHLLESARHAAARSVNAVMTATYWEVGRRIVEYEQGGKARAGYGEGLLRRLSVDLTRRFGRGFSERNLEQMRAFYSGWPISQTLSAESGRPSPVPDMADISRTASAESRSAISATPSRFSRIAALAARFPLPWSHYVRLSLPETSSARHEPRHRRARRGRGERDRLAAGRDDGGPRRRRTVWRRRPRQGPRSMCRSPRPLRGRPGATESARLVQAARRSYR